MKELIERLRGSAHWCLIEGNGDDEIRRGLDEAADALERLTAERDAALAASRHETDLCQQALDDMMKAMADVKRLTAERDSLKEGLDGWHARYLDAEVEFARLVDVCHAAKLRLAAERDELFNRATTAEFERDALLRAAIDKYREDEMLLSGEKHD